MLGEVVGYLEGTLSPYESKLALSNLVSHPVEAHVKKIDSFCLMDAVGMPFLVYLSVKRWCASWRMGMT